MRSQTSVGMSLFPTLVECTSDSQDQMQEGIDTHNACGRHDCCVSAIVSLLGMLNGCPIICRGEKTMVGARVKNVAPSMDYLYASRPGAHRILDRAHSPARFIL